MAHRPGTARKAKLAMHLVCMSCGSHIQHGMMNRHYDSLHPRLTPIPEDRKPEKLVPEKDVDDLDRPYDVHPLFQSRRISSLFELHPPIDEFRKGAPECTHTDDEIRAMAHKIHVSEQADNIRQAVDNDPAFFGAEGVDDLVPAPVNHGLHGCTTECRF